MICYVLNNTLFSEILNVVRVLCLFSLKFIHGVVQNISKSVFKVSLDRHFSCLFRFFNQNYLLNHLLDLQILVSLDELKLFIIKLSLVSNTLLNVIHKPFAHLFVHHSSTDFNKSCWFSKHFTELYHLLITEWFFLIFLESKSL